jgi:uncharacterized ferritin-like protein (DUF455 family)
MPSAPALLAGGDVATLGEAALAVLSAADPDEKRRRARRLARGWRRGDLAHEFPCAMPDQPAWPDKPELLPPGRMKRRKLGSDQGRITLIHALAHIEFVAMDLAADLIGRFGAQFPRQFCDDWVAVLADEAMHFAILNRRLHSLGSHYGALPAHAGLWESAERTSDDALARLAIVPMVLEARGLDVTPATIERFAAVGDSVTARMLNRIYNDEIRHVSAGTVWFQWMCDERRIPAIESWQNIVKQRFRGELKPPFNDSARHRAGLTQDFYALIA